MGLGKTGQCIETCKRLEAERILVICPALARQTWRNELSLWWPEQFTAGDGKAGVIYANPERKSLAKKARMQLQEALKSPARIVSAELLDVNRERAFLTSDNATIGGQGKPRPENTVVILDEVHYYVNADAGRSRAVEQILAGFDGPVLAASATPIPNRISGLWNVLNIIWPGRFGYPRPGHPIPYAFLDAYVERNFNGHGMSWGGLRPDRAEEFRERLTHMLSRTTRKDVRRKWPGLLPACQLIPLALESGRAVDVAKTWVQNALISTNYCCVLTNLRATAADIATLLSAADLGPGVQVLHVDGSTPPEERNNKIKALRDAPKGVLVTTMHAVCEAISLSWCHRALIAELYWRPKTVVQVIGRFPRLDGDTDIVIDVLCGADSVQAKMAVALADKLLDQAKVIPVGAADEGLINVFNSDAMDDELLNAACSVAGGGFEDVEEEL
jgi:superfamily II DNA or RNA helicase